ncbi:succinate dehydrogenase, hydrophobic membrane anchor protein [Blastomonas marina]|uniref:Succinate dehydrogenase hydrophobic membrane anchor subunit n=1 Tax=Blastomonas marina TaxID=1867408 RepID=A0ABQ1F8L0_9SPHN|nr:succinate dehydrogenase, hydrophobic membrane anchor protein [Blastomonas marina]GGA02777.1 succinate dehydrogenase, hydrophobic membrane anchor protein [Blastomonas marina]
MAHETPIGRARGLGSAHHGTHHWLLQRFTAIGNLVAVLFLVISFLLLDDYGYAGFAKWVASPLPALALSLLVISVFWHARLGLQVLVEDYVNTAGNRFALNALLNIAAFAGAGFALISIARIVFAGAA